MKILRIMVIVALCSGASAMAMGGGGDRERGRELQIGLQAKQQLQQQLNQQLDIIKNRLDIAIGEIEVAEVAKMLRTVRTMSPHATGEARKKAIELESRLTELQAAAARKVLLNEKIAAHKKKLKAIYSELENIMDYGFRGDASFADKFKAEARAEEAEIRQLEAELKLLN